ncbi:MAG TPA: heavy metal-binding domain-containing protein [Capillimicrobium sp.]|jgi:uncharacterized protein YbjQ (UPF0145 family)|nr:heavy metal-binding domain-containing protein [Capillimicrobium sp.]
MLISTMNDLPGYEVEEVLGEVFGLTVRSRNVGSQIGASFKSLVGAILAFRFDTSELGTTWTEICAYGTAVRARKLS